MGRYTNYGTSFGEPADIVPLALRLVAIISCLVAMVAIYQGVRSPATETGKWEETPSAALTATETSAAINSDGPPDAYSPPHQNGGTSSLSSAPSASFVSSDRGTAEPPPTHADTSPRIGIVAGHWGSNDTGAVCPDGLREVDINLDVATRVVTLLQSLGYRADLLAEYDPRLTGYRADALVSIHADSCEEFPYATPPASGFKVARVEDSMVPAQEDRLVTCLAQCYATETGMYFHENSITYDMTRYHNFYEIDDQTPAAIIETGFMALDREMLTEHPDRIAQGIVAGIVCFIEADAE